MVDGDVGVEHRILHDRLIVVGSAGEAFFDAELVFPFFLDVVPVYVEVLLTVGTRLFVRHTEHVAQLVDSHADSSASVYLQIERQTTERVSHDFRPLPGHAIHVAAFVTRSHIDRRYPRIS